MKESFFQHTWMSGFSNVMYEYVRIGFGNGLGRMAVLVVACLHRFGVGCGCYFFL